MLARLVGLAVVTALAFAAVAAAQDASGQPTPAAVGEVITLGADTEIHRDDLGGVGSWGVTEDDAATITIADGVLRFSISRAPLARSSWLELGVEAPVLWVRAVVAMSAERGAAGPMCGTSGPTPSALFGIVNTAWRVGRRSHGRQRPDRPRTRPPAAGTRSDAGGRRHRQRRVRRDRRVRNPGRRMGRRRQRRRCDPPRGSRRLFSCGALRGWLRRGLRSDVRRRRGRPRRHVRAAGARPRESSAKPGRVAGPIVAGSRQPRAGRSCGLRRPIPSVSSSATSPKRSGAHASP